jgi:hypothetical protein
MATTITRNSSDDRKGPAKSSPFRSTSDLVRMEAALEMVAKREEELTGLLEIMASISDTQTQRILAQRIRATKNNLDSWKAYVSGANEKYEEAYREPRAVVTLKKKPTTRKRVAKAA